MLKTAANLSATVGQLIIQGSWNASTNTPTLTSGVGTKGFFYVVSVAGTTNLDGITDWQLGDWAVFNGTAWIKVDNTDQVLSVFGRQGAVVAAYGDYQNNLVTYPASAKIGNPTHIDDLQEILNHEWSSGVVGGCDLTNNGNGTVSFSSGYAMLRASADAHTTLYSCEVQAQNNLALTDGAGNYIYLDYNAGTPTFVASTSISSFNCLDKCISYLVYREGTQLYVIDAREQNVDGNRKSRRLFLDFSTFIHASGGTMIGSPSGLNVSVTSGSFYFMLQQLPHVAFDTSVAGTANANVFAYYYRNGLGGWTKVANSKTVSNSQYDDGTGTLASLGSNKYMNNWVYLLNDGPSSLAIQYGQAQYSSLSAAQAGTIPTPPPICSSIGVLIGRIITQQGTATPADVSSTFSTVFTPSAATNHNNLAGLQGGATSAYYHSDQAINQADSPTFAGLNLTSATAATVTYGGSALPQQPTGFVTVSIGGVARKIPYY